MQSQLTQKQIETTVSIIYKARTDTMVKLRFGARRRQSIIEAMKANDESYKTDYRYMWLKEARNQLVQSLGDLAKQFQAKNPHDIISVTDMVDVAEALLVVLKDNQS